MLNPAHWETLHIEVETGKSTELEAKWIIGFTLAENNSVSVPALIYCKLVQLPSNMKKVGVTLCAMANRYTPAPAGYSRQPQIHAEVMYIYSYFKINSNFFLPIYLYVGNSELKT